MAKLKLFKVVSGFHDSFVAATSRAAALKAWGARTDLFAMGAAEQVDDPEMLREASRSPGQTLQRKRIGKDITVERRSPQKSKPKADLAKTKAALRKAESAQKAAASELQRAQREIDKERAALDRRERALDRRYASNNRKLAEAVERARQLLNNAS